MFVRLKSDFSFTALFSGLMIVLVGMTSSAVLVFQAAQAFHSTHLGSWLGSLCIGMGILTIYFSIKYRTPVLIAWSVAGSALLAASASGFSEGQAVGAFLFSSLLVFLFGITGWFEKVMNRIPISLCSALLSGTLIHYCLGIFILSKQAVILIGLMLLTYILGRKFQPHLTMLYVTITGLLVSIYLNLFQFSYLNFKLTDFHIVPPEFSISALIGLGIPLFIVTMASQNLTGISVLRSHGYTIPISSTLSKMGLMGGIVAYFGGFTINYAAVTAALAMGKDVHPDPDKRYISAVVSGSLYIAIGFFSDSIMSLFLAFPGVVVAAIAGFALLGTVSSNIESALSHAGSKEASFLTFIVAASGVSFFGIGSAFWAIIVGMSVYLLLKFDFKSS